MEAQKNRSGEDKEKLFQTSVRDVEKCTWVEGQRNECGWRHREMRLARNIIAKKN